MNTDKVFWSEFLELYKSLPVLWDVKNENYYNRVEKDAAYDELVDKLQEIDPDANRETVKRKINAFRTSYRRYLKQTENSRADNLFQPTLWYFDLLHFLTDQEEHSKAKSNISDDESVSDRSNEVFDRPVKQKNVKEVEILKESSEELKDSKVMDTQYADNVFWSEFLDMYKALPVLWDVKNENYRNRVQKKVAYKQLVDKLKEIDPEASLAKVKRKLNTFRTNYNRELKKIEKSGAGSDDEYQSTLWYFDRLHFLTDQEEHSKVERYMRDDDSISDRSNEVFDSPVKQNIAKKTKIIKMACDKVQESNDAISVLAESWASQYTELGKEQKVLGRRIFADIMFHGCMNRLTEKMVEDIHHILKNTSNTSTPIPTALRSSSPIPNYKEYSSSPQPQFTFVAYQQNDKTQVSHTTKSKQCDVVRLKSSKDLQSTPRTHIPPSQSIVAKEVIQRSSLSTTNVKEYIVPLANDNDNENALNNSDESDDITDEEEYENMLDEVDDDDDDMMESIDHEDDSHDEITNKNLCQKPEENPTSNPAEVAVRILNDIREGRLKPNKRRKYINWQNLNDDECRELKRLQRIRDCVCDQCGKHFTDLGNLKVHQLRHSGIKNYECVECKAKFYTAPLLKRHSLIHKSKPPQYACKYCGKTFIYNNYRLHHERSHFMERRFHCDYCDKSFYKAYAKRNHELKHIDCREFHCELCDQYFLRKTHLMAHYRSKTHKNREQETK